MTTIVREAVATPETPPESRVIVCFDMWDSLMARRKWLATDREVLEADSSFLNSFAPVRAYNDAVLAEFASVRVATGVDAQIVKLLGDGSMFSFPGAEVRTALLFLVRALLRVSRMRSDIPPATAAAASFGLTLLTRKQFDGQVSTIADIVGYPVDVASRLVTLAGPNQVLVCENLVRQVAELQRGESVDLLGHQTQSERTPNVLDQTITDSLRPVVLDPPASPPSDRFGRVLALPGSGAPTGWHRLTVGQLLFEAPDCGPQLAGRYVLPVQNPALRRVQLINLWRSVDPTMALAESVIFKPFDEIIEEARARRPSLYKLSTLQDDAVRSLSTWGTAHIVQVIQCSEEIEVDRALMSHYKEAVGCLAHLRDLVVSVTNDTPALNRDSVKRDNERKLYAERIDQLKKLFKTQLTAIAEACKKELTGLFGAGADPLHVGEPGN